MDIDILFHLWMTDYTRYYWIFSLILKSEALNTFKHFKLLVEKQFFLSIKSFQFDMRGEFRVFGLFLQQQGIHLRYSYPHTQYQNRVVERKNRHIVETGLAFLPQVNLPLAF